MDMSYNTNLVAIYLCLYSNVKAKLKKTCLASRLFEKKEGGGPFFLLQNGRQTNFPKLLSIETYSDKTKEINYTIFISRV